MPDSLRVSTRASGDSCRQASQVPYGGQGRRHASFAAAAGPANASSDTFGHDVGDTVFCEIDRLFASRAGDGQQVIRDGGDEFVVAMSGVEIEAARIRRTAPARGLRDGMGRRRKVSASM
ncbi:MAG: diguanylate cyclase domain-containing protein [Acidimicrobiales bacterium]